MGSRRVLTDEQVRRLRAAPAGTVSQLCREMGINRNTGMNVVNGSCYRDVPDKPAAMAMPEPSRELVPAPRLMAQQHAGSIFKLAAQPDLYRLLMSSRSYMRHL